MGPPMQAQSGMLLWAYPTVVSALQALYLPPHIPAPGQSWSGRWAVMAETGRVVPGVRKFSSCFSADDQELSVCLSGLQARDLSLLRGLGGSF